MLSMVGFSIAPLLLELIMTCAVLVPYGWSYSMITLVTISGYVAFTLAVTAWRTKFRRGMNDMDNETSNKALDAMLNYETVKYFTAEHAVIERYDASLMGYFKMVLSTQLSLALLNFGQALIITAGLTLSMGLAASEVSEGTLTVGELVAINAYILQLYLPLNWLGTSYRMIVNSITDLEKLFDLFDEKSDVEDPTDPVPLVVSSKSSASVEFRNVSFSYPKRGEAEAVPVLNGLSFAVPAGRTVALVGPSGSGKTTIGRLLCRFYDPSEGSILIGDTNIKAVTQRDLRSHIGVVPQDTVLFNETLRYNVEFGSVGCEDGTKLHMTPEQAADEASLGPFVDNLPDGWETVVGERGLRLSGGEKQRVSIARTFVKDPEILILDEATSALDSRSERDIQESLQKVSKGRTTLVIAHRLSTIVDADLIVVLKDGRLAEQGQHHELLARPGSLYAEMWRLQQDQDFAKAEEGSADDMDDRPVTESLL
jgi:ATP-binding cassette subfamily B protein